MVLKNNRVLVTNIDKNPNKNLNYSYLNTTSNSIIAQTEKNTLEKSRSSSYLNQNSIITYDKKSFDKSYDEFLNAKTITDNINKLKKNKILNIK